LTIDERLEFLVQSTESLHASLQELHAMMAEQARAAAEQAAEQAQRMAATDARERRLRHALLRGIQEFLAGLDDGGPADPEAAT